MTPTRTPSTDHARHDRLLVIRYLDLDDDLLAGEVSTARSLLATCPDCAALATELQLITDATSRMALPSRPRDFRLTPQQAASLQPGGFRRFLENLGSAFRFEFLRPLAGAAVAVGLLLAVIGSLPQLGASSATAALAPNATQEAIAGDAATAAPARVPTAGPAYAADTSPAATTGVETNAGSAPTPAASGVSQPVTAPAVSPPQPAPTTKPAVSTAQATGLASNRDQTPSPAAGGVTTGPSGGNTIAGGVPSATLAPVPPELPGSGAGAVALGSNADNGTISPLVILGVLLAIVGLVVIFLTFVARRIGRSAG